MAPTVVVPGVHAVAEVQQAADGVSVTPIGGGVQGGEHVAVRRVHLVLQVLYQHLYELHPPLQPPHQSRLQIWSRIRAPHVLMMPRPGECVIPLRVSSEQLSSQLLMHKSHSQAVISPLTANFPPAASDGDCRDATGASTTATAGSEGAQAPMFSWRPHALLEVVRRSGIPALRQRARGCGPPRSGRGWGTPGPPACARRALYSRPQRSTAACTRPGPARPDRTPARTRCSIWADGLATDAVELQFQPGIRLQ